MIPSKVIAYVDNDPDDIDMLVDAFKEVEGVKLIGFTDQDAFLAYLLSSPPDLCLVLLDVNMPIRSGPELAKFITNLPQAKNFAITLFSTSRNLFLKAEPVWPFLPKPINVPELHQTVNHLVGVCRML